MLHIFLNINNYSLLLMSERCNLCHNRVIRIAIGFVDAFEHVLFFLLAIISFQNIQLLIFFFGVKKL